MDETTKEIKRLEMLKRQKKSIDKIRKLVMKEKKENYYNSIEGIYDLLKEDNDLLNREEKRILSMFVMKEVLQHMMNDTQDMINEMSVWKIKDETSDISTFGLSQMLIRKIKDGMNVEDYCCNNIDNIHFECLSSLDEDEEKELDELGIERNYKGNDEEIDE